MDKSLKLKETNIKLLITGGTGFIGSRLCQILTDRKYNVTVLTRNKEQAASMHPNAIRFIESLDNINEQFDVIVNLAGEPLSGRWTDSKKKAIYDSRLNTTQKVADYIHKTTNKPSLLISSSGVGFYGDSESETFTEDSNPVDHNFLNDLSTKWEHTANQAKEDGVRVCTLRTAIVLGKNGGVLKQMLLPFKLGLGGKLSHGRQWMSWIHIDDLIGIMIHIINHPEIEGPVNGSAPNPVTNKEFTKSFSKALHRPAYVTLPAFYLKFLFGEMGDTLLLKGQKVLPQKVLDTGYKFQYENISDAFATILTK